MKNFITAIAAVIFLVFTSNIYASQSEVFLRIGPPGLNLCLRAPENSQNQNGARIRVETCQNKNEFKFIKIANPGSDGKSFKFKSKFAGTCLDVWESYPDAIHLWSCHTDQDTSNINQLFKVFRNSGIKSIKSKKSNLCVNLDGSNNINQTACNSSINQKIAFKMKSSQNGIMFGVYSIEPPKNGLPSGWLGVETLLGKKLPAVLLYAHFTETGSSTLTTFQNSVGQFMDRDFNLGKRRNWQVGLEPITLDLFEPSPENPSVKVVIPNNQKSRVNEVIQGAWDQWYINWFTSAVNKAKQQNCIIYIRFASEMNGTWTSWSANKNMPNGSSKFLQMWQHVYNIARQQNIDPDKKYLKFVWAPMIGGLSENFYPGDNFVDWVGLSVYNDNGNFNDTYTHLKLFHDYYGLSKNKPMMITESGYWIDGGNLPVAVNWTRSLVEAVKDTDTFSMLKAFFWFDCINFRFETHPEMLEIFTNAINSPLFVADPINY